MLKRLALLSLLLIAAAPAFAAFAIFQTCNPCTSFTPQWQPLRMGAGGQITAVYNYSDGTTLARSDSYGAWLYEATGSCTYGGTTYAAPCWQQVITATSIPGFSIDLTDSGGAVEYVAAPSNTNTQYLLYVGNLYVTTNRGVTWCKIPSATGFPGTTQNANNGNASGPFIAVDPNNPGTVYVDTLSHGVYTSSNATSCASSTFIQVTAVGTTTGHVIVFQPGSSTHILIYTIGTSGAFESTNGSTFSAVAAGSPPPSTLVDPHLVADKFNQFWLLDSKGGATSHTLWRWASSTWTAITPSNTGEVAAFAADPNSATVGANHIVTVNFAGQPNISSDNGTTWSGDNTNQTISVGASQPSWLANANQGSTPINLNGYSITFDQSSNLFFAGGLGLWETNAPITASATPWNANTLGIEQLVAGQFIAPPGYDPVFGVWDKGFFLSKNPDVFPSNYWDSSAALNPILGGWALDWASADPTFITGFERSNISTSTAPAFSTDGGNTWTPWQGLPTSTTLAGANIAALDSQHWIVAPFGQPIQVTANQGVSWANATVPGSPTNWSNGGGVGFGLAADRVAASTYCAVNLSQNFFFSTNSGVTFSASGLTSASVDGAPNAYTFKSVPGESGVFFYTAGEQTASAGAHPANTHLWKISKTTNPCDTATDVDVNLKEVMAFGFGVHNPNVGGSFPTIYADGWLNGTQGIFQSNDGGTTWATINVPASQLPWPLNQADFPIDITGDPDIYGRVYVVFAGSAAAYIDTADACPSISFSNVNPNASFAIGTPVTLQAQHSGLVPITSVSFYFDGVLIGTQTSPSGQTYSQSWTPGGTAGSHELKVQAVGNGCTTMGNFKSMPITTH